VRQSAAGFWQRRIVDPVLAQLRQGITPDKIALTIALGTLLAIFPILGATTLLCALVAAGLRLNQPVIQLVNYLMYPLQLILLLPFYRAGEWLGAPHLSLSIPQLLGRFTASPQQFVVDFGVVALGGIAVWFICAPPAIALIYFSLRTPLRVAARRIRPEVT
jgi:uncharacterized protein (DUF2062 family)